jgi:SAM-dependent methyltransferase
MNAPSTLGTPDPFSAFKATQREAWASFAQLEGLTTPPAAHLVAFAGIAPDQRVLDVGCGTGVVAITAARKGAVVSGVDLTPALLERARQSAAIAGVACAFVEGDAEALPYRDATFDVVLSQFGHMFAPRPALATSELLRVLKPGGRVAFATWPPEEFMGRVFALAARYAPAPPAAAPVPARVVDWGDPAIVRERLGGAVTDLTFERGTMLVPAPSPEHARASFETTLGPLARVVAALQASPERLEQLRSELLELVRGAWRDNQMHQHFLLTRATKHE